MSPRDSTEIGERVAPDVKLKNKPKPSKLRQQKLPAWQPILTASTVIPTVLCVGLVFIPIGIALFLASESVQEYKLDYTNCTLGSLCTLTLDVKEDMEGDIYFYYYLENFYQNHRRYVKSRNDKQYLGELDQTSDCEPFATKTVGGNSIPIAPCGAVANSMFNDTFRITYTEALKNLNVPVTATGITWDVDINKKFKNPPIPAGQTLCDVFKNTVRPPNWTKDLCLMGGFTNPDFIVWMRTAALPNFRKLWRRLDRSQEQVLTPDFQNGLPKGSYQIFVENNYPVTSFGGRKAFIVSTTSWAGGKNSFLGIAYLVVGSLAIVLAVVFIVIHVKFGHSVNELSNVAPAHQ